MKTPDEENPNRDFWPSFIIIIVLIIFIVAMTINLVSHGNRLDALEALQKGNRIQIEVVLPTNNPAGPPVQNARPGKIL